MAKDQGGQAGGQTFTVDPKGNIVPQVPPLLPGKAGGVTDTGVPGQPPPGNLANPPSGTAGGSPGAQGDYSTMLGIYGLPPDVQAKVNQIFAQTPDVNQATALALAYIRGTTWYAQTYPGIKEGISSGLLNNEADYRAYVNAIDQYTQQYYNTNATTDQIASYLKFGYNPGHVGQLFQGQATVAANSANWQYSAGQFGSGQMTPDQLTALGNEKAGIDTSLGQQLQNHLQQSLVRMQKAFNGVVSTPSLNLGQQGINAPAIGRLPTAGGQADVAA